MKRIQLRVAAFEGGKDRISVGAWMLNPTYSTVDAFVVNQWFAVHGKCYAGDIVSESEFTVTHRPTGLAAATACNSITDAVRVARQLTRAYAADSWNFTDPMMAKGMKRAARIVKAKR